MERDPSSPRAILRRSQRTISLPVTPLESWSEISSGATSPTLASEREVTLGGINRSPSPLTPLSSRASTPTLIEGSSGLNSIARTPELQQNPIVHTPQRRRRRMARTPAEMPRPQGRDAPSFHRNTPENLNRYLAGMEDLFRDFSVTDDQAKKRYLGRYADATTEEEWSAMDTFANTSTYAEHKTEILSTYPEAHLANEGTLARLKKICREFKSTSATDIQEVHNLRRRFNAESKKLLGATPAVVSNRELVEMLLGCLEDDFRKTVQGSLSLSVAAMRRVGGANAPAARRPEDPYELSDVMDTMLEVAKSSLTGGGAREVALAVKTEPASASISALEAKLASSLESIKQEFQQQASAQRDWIDIMQKQFSSEISNRQRDAGLMRKALQQGQNQIAPANDGGCFYCRGPHRVAECEEKRKEVEDGRILIVEGRVYAPDGRPFPRDTTGQLCLKERVQEYYRRRAAAAASVNYQNFDYEDVIPADGLSYSNWVSSPRDHRDTMIHDLQVMMQSREPPVRQMVQRVTPPTVLYNAPVAVQPAVETRASAAVPEWQACMQQVTTLASQVAQLTKLMEQNAMQTQKQREATDQERDFC